MKVNVKIPDRLSMFLLLIVFVMFSYLIFNCKTEPFVASKLHGYDYNPIATFYKEKIDKKLNSLNASDIIKQKNRGPQLGSYDQKTNNQRHWKEPDNGTCLPSDVCNILYKENDILQDSNSIVSSPPDILQQNRINFYTYDIRNTI